MSAYCTLTGGFRPLKVQYAIHIEAEIYSSSAFKNKQNFGALTPPL